MKICISSPDDIIIAGVEEFTFVAASDGDTRGISQSAFVDSAPAALTVLDTCGSDSVCNFHTLLKGDFYGAYATQVSGFGSCVLKYSSRRMKVRTTQNVDEAPDKVDFEFHFMIGRATLNQSKYNESNNTTFLYLWLGIVVVLVMMFYAV